MTSIALRPHQIECSAKGLSILRNYGIVYLAMQPRVGKTLTAIDIMQKAGKTNILFITKLGPAGKTIASIKGDLLAYGPSYKSTIINYEMLHKLVGKPSKTGEVRLAYTDFDCIVVDEAHSCGAYPKANKTIRQVRALCWSKDVIMLSGTPSPESYSQLYHQLYVSDRSPYKQFGTFYAWFRKFGIPKQVMRNGMMINEYKKVDLKLLEPTYRHLFVDYSQEQAGFKQVIEEQVIDVPMPPVISSLIKTLKKNHCLVEADFAALGLPLCKIAISETGADLINKIAQLCGGTLLLTEGDPDYAVPSESMQVGAVPAPTIFNMFADLDDMTEAMPSESISIEQEETEAEFDFVKDKNGTILSTHKADYIKERFAGRKIAILYRFRAEFEVLKSVFPNWTSNADHFNEAPGTLVFIAQISSAREGLNLSTADDMVFYNIEFSARSYWQCRERFQSIDRATPATIYWIFFKGGIESDVLDRVNSKKPFTWSYYKRKIDKPAKGQLSNGQ